MTFMLKKVGRGKSAGWLCRVRNHHARGWGSRPDLAIRSWQEQNRRYQRNLHSTYFWDSALGVFICNTCDYAGDTESEMQRHDCPRRATTTAPNLRPKKG